LFILAAVLNGINGIIAEVSHDKALRRNNEAKEK
jgi:hypothetical protein